MAMMLDVMLTSLESTVAYSALGKEAQLLSVSGKTDHLDVVSLCAQKQNSLNFHYLKIITGAE